MTTELTLLKTLLTTSYITEKGLTDDYLTAYLTLASNSISKWKGSENYDTSKYINERVKIAQLNILKVGAEGQLSHSENGISRVYSYPDVEIEVLKNIPRILR